MDALIYTAMSGAERALRAQQVHANNLANMETGGFRANLEVASAQSLSNYGYGYDGRHMTQMQASAIATRSGAVKETGRDLDVAITGPGYLAVQWQNGEAYTRAGAINIDETGALSINGHALLGEGGPIVLPEYSSMSIGGDGTISILPPGATQMQTIDKIKLVNAEAGELTKNEAGLIVSRGGEPLPTDPAVKMRDRHLEGSNVSAVEEMVATMSLNRSFEIQMKLFKAADSMNETGNRLLGS
ncbi:flagellar basal body rod protein FlgF [Janthinobacterium fluminis]|uniref:Flagellar basal-body rod protein FlgF n=1 Tax=Janthinobacterium fluminis TaxID=2987524 RepID=A0ABT5JVM4_9BURK|nr:flagellar basal body rod protein FlgF [Janthinobacterium fluminis]MDC8756480.1 flagellar basal body rod protein FlgF [Janthinobacterium fluminis]